MRKRNKLCPYRRSCADACYGDNPCDFALEFDALSKKLERWKQRAKTAEAKVQPETEKPSPLVYGDYVLTPQRNAFNSQMSWWISKKGCTVARYCFTAPVGGPELERQLLAVNGYIKMFEEGMKCN